MAHALRTTGAVVTSPAPMDSTRPKGSSVHPKTILGGKATKKKRCEAHSRQASPAYAFHQKRSIQSVHWSQNKSPTSFQALLVLLRTWRFFRVRADMRKPTYLSHTHTYTHTRALARAPAIARWTRVLCALSWSEDRETPSCAPSTPGPRLTILRQNMVAFRKKRKKKGGGGRSLDR